MDIKKVNGGNGGGRVCHTFGDSVRYPVKFDLKAIIDASIPPEKSMGAMETLFKKFEVPFAGWRQRASSGGKYISYTVSVDISSEDQLNKLYADLKKIPGLKFAL